MTSASPANDHAGRIALVDAMAGCSGDMLLGALVDAGLDITILKALPGKLGLHHVDVRSERVTRGAFAATKVHVSVHGHDVGPSNDTHHAHSHSHEATGDHDHRTLADVLHILGHAGTLESGPLAKAAHAFRLLADAEARVHGMSPEDIHFHEVGGADAIVDMAGVCIGFAELGIQHVAVSSLPWGSGTTNGAHGTFSIPAPATIELLKGFPTQPSGETYEQVTPTGAALLCALRTDRALPSGFSPERTGVGAGTFEGGAMANVVRLVIGSVASVPYVESDRVVLLETNLDDATGEVVAHAMAQVLSAGALDVWAIPVTMKKNRPGVVLSVLVEAAQQTTIENLLFAETKTLGIRVREVSRRILPRRSESVNTSWGPVAIKVRVMPDGREEASPEYESCAAVAAAHRVSLRQVQDAAMQAFHRDT